MTSTFRMGREIMTKEWRTSHRCSMIEVLEPRCLLAATLIADIFAGPNSSDINNVTPFGSGVVFAADDGLFGSEPWYSSGAPGSASLIANLADDPAMPGPESSNPIYFTSISGSLYFNAGKLTRWDPGPNLITTLPVGGPQNPVLFNGHILVGGYLGTDSINKGFELLITDGNEEETKLLADVNSGFGSSYAADFKAFDSVVLFSATSDTAGREL